MSPQHKCVETVKEMTAEVIREKNALVGRLNAMHQRIAEEEDPVTKMRRKVEWAAEKDRSVEALNKIVASLQSALDEEDGMAEMEPADRSTHGSTASHKDSDSGNFSSTSSVASLSSSAFSQYLGSPSTPQRKLATRPLPLTPHRRLPALLDKDGGEHISSPASKAAVFLTSLSREASLVPHQVRKSLKMRAQRFSASILERVGWNPVRQESEWVWDFSV